MYRVLIFGGFLFTTMSLALADEPWPQWLGPNRDGASKETGLLKSWDGPPPLVWKVEGIGPGYSSASVVGGRVYTVGDREGTLPGDLHPRMEVYGINDRDGSLLWRADVGEACN